MNTQERLKRLFDQVSKRTADDNEVLRELRDVLHDFDGVNGAGNYREKITNAIEQVQRGLHHPDARDQVLQYIDVAADIAGELQGR
jgi:hypothetical protein